MATKCSNCGSATTQAMVGDRYGCLTCGCEFNGVTGEHMPTDSQLSPPEAPQVWTETPDGFPPMDADAAATAPEPAPDDDEPGEPEPEPVAVAGKRKK